MLNISVLDLSQDDFSLPSFPLSAKLIIFSLGAFISINFGLLSRIFISNFSPLYQAVTVLSKCLRTQTFTLGLTVRKRSGTFLRGNSQINFTELN